MCGVVGIYSPGEDAFSGAVDGLFQMQHRGQDACGLAISDLDRIRVHKKLGYVREVFGARPYPEFSGSIICGHVRYPTQGANRATNAQPHAVKTLEGTQMALASNGDITNYQEIRRWLEERDVELDSSNDSELIVKFIAYHTVREGMTTVEAIRAMQDHVRGAYSSCLLTRDRLYAIRDLHAIRPLCYGGDGKRWVVASETTALDINHVDMIDELDPGEIVEFGPDGVIRHSRDDVVEARGGREKPAHCVFEHVYFSRPDSIAFGHRVYDVRKRIGRWLAKKDDVRADVVVPVPDSANAVALGYAHESGATFEFGLIRNHYVGRTFIRPEQRDRDSGVKQKFNPLRSVFKGRSVVLVDDSIVRGTTLRKIVRMVRQCGAAEIHVRIGSPVTKFSCYYGVDTPDADELIGNRLAMDGIREHLTADTLKYMTVEGLKECVEDDGDYCFACFDGQYPVALTETKTTKDVEPAVERLAELATS